MPLLMCWRFKSQVIYQLCRKTINYIFIFSDNYKSRTLHKSPSQSDELPQSKSEEKPAEEVWVWAGSGVSVLALLSLLFLMIALFPIRKAHY